MNFAHDLHGQCTDPTMRRMLLTYSVRRCTEVERDAFELHLLVCDVCFQDLVALLRVSSLIAEWTDPSAQPEVVLSRLVREGAACSRVASERSLD